MSTSSAANTAAEATTPRGRPSPAAPSLRPHIQHPLLAALCLLLSGNLPAPATAATSADYCTPQSSETIRIRHVHDGDTVVRADGERIRLIGLDTPELARDGKTAEPFAHAARDRLRALIDSAGNISARYGPERRDDYGRLLAHLYTGDRNLQAELLAAGLATPLFIAPNLGHADCYRQAAEQARTARRGIWQLPQYQPRPATSLDGSERGYHIITGTVRRVGHSRCCVWLNLDGDVALRLAREHLPLFEPLDFDDLDGRQVEARGYLYRRNNELRMNLRHPADMKLLAKD